jgi:hypothetical protein
MGVTRDGDVWQRTLAHANSKGVMAVTVLLYRSADDIEGAYL